MARSKSAPRRGRPSATLTINAAERPQEHGAEVRSSGPPLPFWVDPNMPDVQLTEDLASVGLELAADKDGARWLRRSDKITFTPHSKLSHLGAIAQALEVPLWVMMIPDLPADLLKEPGAPKLVQLIQTYVSSDPLRRLAIDLFVAPNPPNEPPPAQGADDDHSIEARIEDQRGEMFGAMAIVAVARDSIDKDDNYDLARALEEAYDRFYEIAGELNGIAIDSKEACHG